jgi:ribosomal protein S18 acetylase RimI-like enzyme
MSNVTIAVLGEADADALALLQSEFTGLQTTPQQAANRLRNSQGIEYPLLARVDGAVAGFASLRLHPYLGEDVPYAELSELYVRPQFRRMGVARALLTTLEEKVRRSGATGWAVLTDEENDAALAAYRAWGFRPFSVALQKWLSDERPYRIE